MFRLMPGDPTASMLEPEMSVQAQEMLLERFGLDRPLHEQYFVYLGNLLQGDLGISFHYRQPVFEIISTYAMNTIILMITAIIFSYAIGVSLGIIGAWYRGSKLESGMSAVVLICRSLPPFFLGMLGIMIFSFGLEWLPHSGMRTPGHGSENFFELYFSMDFLKHLILPVLMSSIYYIARPTLIMRNTMLDLIGADFIEMAEAKGLRKSRIMFIHAGRNALLPVVTNLALFLGMAIGGAVTLEYVFGWPGLGREIVLAAERHDYPLAQASFLMLAFIVMVLNFLVDILYAYLDPRVSYQ
ncbi:peptide ABC transporter permease [Natranaerobius trueperi]|uniref:Peptide ABC transporter permease n=2 Tax=Natranaerobius trueperi TaxID=759412 RepID=A0A226BVZ4_9FIRM|nr:peptide ABC transporter permease [Natranaerobius trueperi]